MAEFRINVLVDVRRAIAQARQVGAALDRTTERADRLRNTLTRVAGVLATAFGGGAIVRTLSQFSQAMSTVQAVTGATATQFDALRRQARELGASTRFSATQAAEGMLFLARAGFTVDEVLQSIAGTLRLAQAGALDLGAAADIASNVLSGFRLNAEQTARVVDVLAAGANSSNTSVQQLGEAMKFVAPIAAGLNVTVEEAAAAIGTLSDAGLQGTLAGTGLRRTLSELESPGNRAIEIFDRLGISANEVRVSQVGLIEAFRRLREAGISTGEALEIFGQYGGPGALVLINAIDRTEELAEQLENAGGTAERVSEIMDDNLNGALLRLRSAASEAVLALGDLGVESGLTRTFDAVAAAIRSMAENMDRTVQVAGAFILALAGPRLLAIAGGLLGIGAAAGTAARSIAILTGAVRLLLRAFFFGFVIEAINSVITAIEDMNRVVRDTPATWGDAAAVAVDAFVNGLIGGLVGFSRAIPNVLRIVTDPFATGLSGFFGGIWDVVFGDQSFEELDDIVSENMRVAFFNAVTRVGEDFQADLRRRYIEIASEEQRNFFRATQGTRAGVPPGEPLPPIAQTEEVPLPPGYVSPLSDEQLERLRALRERLEPVAAATKQLAEDQMLLDNALATGNLSFAEHERLVERLSRSYEDLLDPLGAVHRELDQEQRLAGLRVQEREVEIELIAREHQLRQAGIELSDQERDALRERISGNRDLEQQLRREAQVYELIRDPAQTYRESVEALQRVVQRGGPGLTLPDEFEQASGQVRAFGGDVEDILSGAFDRSQEAVQDYTVSTVAQVGSMVDQINQHAGRIQLAGFVGPNLQGRQGASPVLPGPGAAIRDDEPRLGRGEATAFLGNARLGRQLRELIESLGGGREGDANLDRFAGRQFEILQRPEIAEQGAIFRERTGRLPSQITDRDLIERFPTFFRQQQGLLTDIGGDVPDLSIFTDPERRRRLEENLFLGNIEEMFRNTPQRGVRGSFPIAQRFLGVEGEDSIRLPRNLIRPPAAEPPTTGTGVDDPAAFLRSLDPAALERLRDQFPTIMREIERAAERTGYAFEKSSAQIADVNVSLSETVQPGHMVTEAVRLLGNELERNPELAERVEQALTSMRLAYLDTQRTLDAGLERGFTRYAQSATDFATQAENAVAGAFRGMEDAFVQFVTTGELSFEQLVNSIVADLARIAIQQAVLGPIAAGLQGAFAGGVGAGPDFAAAGGAAAPAFATGGLIRGPGSGTSDSILARVSTGEYIVNARATQRYLGHLNAINRSVPAFQTGGLAAPPGPQDSPRGPLVQVIDQRRSDAPPVEVEQGGRGPDGREIIRVMVREEVNSGVQRGDFDRSLGGRFGISPSIS